MSSWLHAAYMPPSTFQIACGLILLEGSRNIFQPSKSLPLSLPTNNLVPVMPTERRHRCFNRGWNMRFRAKSLLTRPGSMQLAGGPADHDDAQAATLRDVDHLLLRGTAKDGQAIFRAREAHHRIERFEVHWAAGADHGKLAHGNGGKFLDDPTFAFAEGFVHRRSGPLFSPAVWN